jgi:hypothetical protein
VRRRHPRQLLERRQRARARVSLVRQPRSEYASDGSISSKQVAEVTLPREELERVWSAEYLERLARTYWRFLTRVSLGLLRVLYTESSRDVVLLTRPFVLLRFSAPLYEIDADGGTVTWPIDRGLLVAPDGRGRGFLRLGVRRLPPRDGSSEATAVVTSEIVSFYALIAGWGGFARIGRFVYNQTQLRIHVIVSNAFLRSLANLDLAPSVVGALRPVSPGARPGSPAASPGRGER